MSLWCRARERVLLQPQLNFLLTNRIPRRGLTRFIGWLSRVEHPLVRVPSIAVWKFFSGADLRDARAARFRSLHDCFTRELRPGARPIAADPAVLVSPCDAIVGARGTVHAGTMLQAKGSSYAIGELLADAALAARHEGCAYLTLRLTAGMYHRFHAPGDCRVARVTHVAGDVWNVNPPAVQRVARLYCRNERAVLHARLPDDAPLTLVAVGAVLVASIRLHCLPGFPRLRYSGVEAVDCDARYRRGDELGWFELGSTIIVVAPPGWALEAGIEAGRPLRMGQAVLRREQ